ncbi:hypothetical protein Tco_0261739 [Tanacetum coccineum]
MLDPLLFYVLSKSVQIRGGEHLIFAGIKLFSAGALCSKPPTGGGPCAKLSGIGVVLCDLDPSTRVLYGYAGRGASSLKAPDEGFSSKNYVRKFLRQLHPKWHAKFTAIKESKDMTSLSINELIESLTSRSEDEEYSMVVRNFKKFSKDEMRRFQSPHRRMPEKPRNKNQRAFIRGSWTDSGEDEEEKIKDETCLMAQSSNEVLPKNEFYSDDLLSIEDSELDSSWYVSWKKMEEYTMKWSLNEEVNSNS